MNKSKKYNRHIAYWLLLGAFMVLTMVVIGGITRLTHSGLSIVTWQPIKGFLPPMNETKWHEAFNAYKQIPEYQKVHHYFTLEDYKKIFFWEYLHRVIGRLIGLLFIFPFLYFLVTKRISNRKLLNRLLLIFLLGAVQGFAGWYMVKSGLVERTSVDHLRLALHMSIAMLVVGVIYWTALQLLYPDNRVQKNMLGKSFYVFFVLLIIQIVYGGLTAGLKAGHVFPTYPKMGVQWLPDIALKMQELMGWKAWYGFPVNVQFVHRWLGFILLIYLAYLYFKNKGFITGPFKKLLGAAVLLILLQYTFGVFVIVLKVPISLAVLHQLTAFILFLLFLTILYFGKPRKSLFI